jgi:hypothetical protein
MLILETNLLCCDQEIKTQEFQNLLAGFIFASFLSGIISHSLSRPGSYMSDIVGCGVAKKE